PPLCTTGPRRWPWKLLEGSATSPRPGRTIPFMHTIWHMFVLAGSSCHYFAVLLYVLPNST
ncbi:MAG TPA: hypothetical protein ENF84_04000, partial [Chloroflexi bacterium]|nr:hypothetical protein [Chloroflexota bacterium]